MKKTIVFDFDGVIHTYSSGWQGVDIITDPANPDVVDVINRLREDGYEVIVVSARCEGEIGTAAVNRFLDENGIVVDGVMGTKPPALVYVDERAVCYRPEVDLYNKIVNFKTWRDTMDGPIVDAVEGLAKELHEAGREAVEKGATVAHSLGDSKTFKFLEWPEISEEAREGRRIQARYLLSRYDITPK